MPTPTVAAAKKIVKPNKQQVAFIMSRLLQTLDGKLATLNAAADKVQSLENQALIKEAAEKAWPAVRKLNKVTIKPDKAGNNVDIGTVVSDGAGLWVKISERVNLGPTGSSYNNRVCLSANLNTPVYNYRNFVCNPNISKTVRGLLDEIAALEWSMVLNGLEFGKLEFEALIKQIEALDVPAPASAKSKAAKKTTKKVAPKKVPKSILAPSM